MTDEETPPLKKGTVLPPERDAHHDANRPMVVSMFNRVRNQVLQKELASLTSKAQTWNQFVSALRDGERLKHEYMAALVRSQNLDQLRLAEEAKVLAEVKQIFDEEEDRQKDRELRSIVRETQLIRAQRDLDALKNPPKAKEEGSRSQRRIAKIKQIRKDRDEMIAIIMENRTEEQLTDEDKQLINDIRLAADNEIKNMLEDRE